MKHSKTKKIITLLLFVIGFILIVAEGRDFLSTFIIKAVAIISLGSSAYTFKHWHLADDPYISKLINED